jgi:hypothetical protein
MKSLSRRSVHRSVHDVLIDDETTFREVKDLGLDFEPAPQ